MYERASERVRVCVRERIDLDVFLDRYAAASVAEKEAMLHHDKRNTNIFKWKHKDTYIYTHI